MSESGRKPNALISSARRVVLDDAKLAKATIGKRQAWQDEAWAYFDEVPEIKFGALFLGDGMSKVRFYASYELDDGTHIPVNDPISPLHGKPVALQADVEMSRLRSAIGGQSELNRNGAINWTVTGEYYIHGIEARAAEGVPGTPGFKPAEPERWDVLSVSQVELTSGTDAKNRPIFKVKMSPDDAGRELDNDRETLIRMWLRHARWTDLADCHMRALLGDCEALMLLVNQQKAEAKSRQAAGLMLVPAELDFASDQAGGDEGTDGEEAGFTASLLRALTEPIEDPSSSASIMPLVITGPAEYLTPDKFRTLNFARGTDATLDARIEAKINRLARGMNVPVEVVMGHMSTTFSNAEQIDEDKFTDHFEPMCEAMADAYAAGFLIPQLREGGYTDEELERVGVWFDASRLVKPPRLEDSADDLWSAGAISESVYRRLKGATDEDAPDEIERVRNLAFTKGIFTAELTTVLLKKAGVLSDDDVGVSGGEVTEVVTPEVNAVRRALVAAAGEVSIGRKLFEIDRDLRTRLLAAAEAAMARALERAGNRLKSKAGAIRDTLATVPAWRSAQHLGPALVASAGFTEDELLAGAWDEFELQFKAWSAQAVEATLDVLLRATVITPEQADARRQQMLAQVDEAWEFTKAELTALAKEVLYHPERGVALTAAAGEADPVGRVPVGIIRRAMALAGGESGMGGDAKTMKPSNKHPIGGIATGSVVMDDLQDGGLSVEAYQWVYGPAQRREFEPHRNLDGVIFLNFDDEVLANYEGWPDTPYFYPGDHDGCACDFEPVVVPMDELRENNDMLRPFSSIPFGSMPSTASDAIRRAADTVLEAVDDLDDLDDEIEDAKPKRRKTKTSGGR